MKLFWHQKEIRHCQIRDREQRALIIRHDKSKIAPVTSRRWKMTRDGPPSIYIFIFFSIKSLTLSCESRKMFLFFRLSPLNRTLKKITASHLRERKHVTVAFTHTPSPSFIYHTLPRKLMRIHALCNRVRCLMITSWNCIYLSENIRDRKVNHTGERISFKKGKKTKYFPFNIRLWVYYSLTKIKHSRTRENVNYSLKSSSQTNRRWFSMHNWIRRQKMNKAFFIAYGDERPTRTAHFH